MVERNLFMNRRDFISLLGACAGCVAGDQFIAIAQTQRIKNSDGDVAVEQLQSPINSINALRCWNFSKWADLKGWAVPPTFTGAVMGGAIWLHFSPVTSNPTAIEQPGFQIGGGRALNTPNVITSPKGLNISTVPTKKIRICLLNLSPETDGYIYWKTNEQPDKTLGPVRFTMESDLKKWQEVTCHMDELWAGTISQISLAFAITAVRGDMWIAQVAITGGVANPPLPRPDVCSGRVVPQIQLPGISQVDFQEAFKVLDDCLITHVPVFGFSEPVMGPGGGYGEDWWQLDSSLAVSGAKWVNQKFAENVMRGFKGVQEQNPDGRIDLYGGSAIRGQVGDDSSLPRLFEMAYDVARRSDDEPLRREIYLMITRYLDWWLSPVKRDPKTGLITGLFEETFSATYKTPQNVDIRPQTLAPTDLNVAVALGCYYAGRLARHLGKPESAKRHLEVFGDLKRSINRYLWDNTGHAYYNYDVREHKLLPSLICTTFDPLRLRIAPPKQAKYLIPMLLNPGLFNWGKLPVTTIAMTEKDFVEATGTYDGQQWFGDVWAMRNLPIVAGLEDIGKHQLAAELAWATIKAFNGRYSEYLVPSTGAGGGVTRYAWSASLYITAIIEHLFGVDFDRIQGYLRVIPRIPTSLFNKELGLRRLIIPTGGETRLNLQVKQTAPGEAQVNIVIDGTLPHGNMEILLPRNGERPKVVTDGNNRKIPLLRDTGDLVNVTGIRIPVCRSIKLQFR